MTLCGSATRHAIKSCLECHRLYMKARRERAKTARTYGFKGPECLECGGIRSEVKESGYTDDGQRIRRRMCLDCGQDCASVELYVDPAMTTFWKLNGERTRRKRDSNYAKRGKGLYRVHRRWTDADRLDVEIRVIRPSRERAA